MRRVKMMRACLQCNIEHVPPACCLNCMIACACWHATPDAFSWGLIKRRELELWGVGAGREAIARFAFGIGEPIRQDDVVKAKVSAL